MTTYGPTAPFKNTNPVGDPHIAPLDESQKDKDEPVSLHPLTPEEALRALMATKAPRDHS